MPTDISRFILGPLENNTYLIHDRISHKAVVIDPSFECDSLISFIQKHELKLISILITHAHFDHIAGVSQLVSTVSEPPLIGLHAQEIALWNVNGDALLYGFHLESLPAPDHLLIDNETLFPGEFEINVVHTPGHSPGHVIFHLPSQGSVFCGDLIFAGGVGRTDLAGGNYEQLIDSIQTRVLTLPDDTYLYPGHGPETTVGNEREHNPFLI